MVETMTESTTETTGTDIAALRVSPAQHLHERFAAAEVTGARNVRLREERFLAMVGLRLDLESPARSRVARAVGADLPAGCGQVGAGDDVAVLWLSPDEFLLVSETRSASQIVDATLAALDGTPGAAVDLSANRTTFRLEGASARAVLEKGCPLDLHPRSFRAGTAVVTTIGRVPILLWQVGEQSYRILPRASFADFLGRWLIDAMAEFAVLGPV